MQRKDLDTLSNDVRAFHNALMSDPKKAEAIMVASTLAGLERELDFLEDIADLATDEEFKKLDDRLNHIRAKLEDIQKNRKGG